MDLDWICTGINATKKVSRRERALIPILIKHQRNTAPLNLIHGMTRRLLLTKRMFFFKRLAHGGGLMSIHSSGLRKDAIVAEQTVNRD